MLSEIAGVSSANTVPVLTGAKEKLTASLPLGLQMRVPAVPPDHEGDRVASAPDLAHGLGDEHAVVPGRPLGRHLAREAADAVREAGLGAVAREDLGAGRGEHGVDVLAGRHAKLLEVALVGQRAQPGEEGRKVAREHERVRVAGVAPNYGGDGQRHDANSV
jgi:hypothetical protein